MAEPKLFYFESQTRDVITTIQAYDKEDVKTDHGTMIELGNIGICRGPEMGTQASR